MQSGNTLKAYQVPSGTKVVVKDEQVLTPVGGLLVEKSDALTVFRVDGAYVRCADADGDIVYIGASTNVEVL